MNTCVLHSLTNSMIRYSNNPIIGTCMCHARDPHFQPYFSAPEHIIFTLRSITILHFWPLRRPVVHFQNSFSFKPFIAAHGRLTAVPRGYSRPECQADASYKVSSGDPHFHPRARSGAPPPFFTLPWHIPTKIRGECPPGGGGGVNEINVQT